MENTGVQGGKQYIISEKSLGFKLEVGEEKIANLLGLRFLPELVGSTYPLNGERAALLQLQHFSAPDSQGMHAGLSSFLFRIYAATLFLPRSSRTVGEVGQVSCNSSHAFSPAIASIRKEKRYTFARMGVYFL